MSDFATRLKKTRELGGLAASELAGLAGLSPGYVRHIEKGVRENPGIEAASAIANVLGVSIDYLVRGEGEDPTEEQVKAAIALARPAESLPAHVEPADPAKPAA